MIYLIGFMGTGKTTVSKILAKKLNAELTDTDEYIEEEKNMSIPDIFKIHGEDSFRKMETSALKELSGMSFKIISCGGGIVLRKENIDIMKSSGMLFCLTAAPSTIYERVKRSTNRPVLNGNMNVQFIEQKLNERAPFYASVDAINISTDGKKPEDIANEIISIYKKEFRS